MIPRVSTPIDLQKIKKCHDDFAKTMWEPNKRGDFFSLSLSDFLENVFFFIFDD